LPVLDGGKVVGIPTETDLLRYLERQPDIVTASADMRRHRRMSPTG
jgi:CBS domain-containing protein